MSARRVFGRAKNQTVGSNHLYTFEMTKERVEGGRLKQGGVRVRRRGSKKVEFVSFSRIAEGNAMTAKIGGVDTSFALTDAGLEIRAKGQRGAKVVPFEALANLGRTQPMLFPES